MCADLRFGERASVRPSVRVRVHLRERVCVCVRLRVRGRTCAAPKLLFRWCTMPKRASLSKGVEAEMHMQANLEPTACVQ